MSDDEEWDEDDWEEEEEWEEDESGEEGSKSPRERRRHLTGVCLGFLSMLPLFLAYELAVRSSGGALRNSSELTLFRWTQPLGEYADPVRWAVLATLAIAAMVICFRRGVTLVPEAARLAFEGALGALLIGPAILACLRFFGESFGDLEVHAASHTPTPGTSPGLADAALVFGGAAYEELLFRVLGFSLLFLLARRVAQFFGATKRIARISSEGIAAVLSSLVFACFHLAAFLPAGWGGGEEFDLGVFAFRVVAGLFLCLLFRWRGPGVAAWSHGLFNLALLVGVSPEV